MHVGQPCFSELGNRYPFTIRTGERIDRPCDANERAVWVLIAGAVDDAETPIDRGHIAGMEIGDEELGEFAEFLERDLPLEVGLNLIHDFPFRVVRFTRETHEWGSGVS